METNIKDINVIVYNILILTVLSCSCYPEQIHISFGEDRSSMVVMWSSQGDVMGSVEYGETHGHLTLSANSTVALLPESAHEAARYIYRSELRNLTENTRYFYKVVTSDRADQRDQRTSQVYYFNTHGDTQTKTMKYLVYGDMGADDFIPTYDVIEKYATSGDYTAIWHAGDMAYDLQSEHGKTGDKFMNKIQPFAAQIPYMTTPGNHEMADDFLHYRTRFSNPGTSWPIPLDKMWYSYDIELVHFISYSTEVVFSYNQYYVCDQFEWLRDDLVRANENRDKTPWIVAIGHRPMYCSNNNGDDCTNRFLHRWVKYALEDLFHAQGVDLIMEAHEHSYERLWPVYNDDVYSYNYDNPRASVHVISGAAGSLEGMNWMSSGNEDWSAFKADEKSKFTFGSLEIHNRTHLYFEQREATQDKILDKFWLVQNHHGPFVANITCNVTGNSIHPSCTCPPPIHYIFYIVMASVTALIIIIGCIAGCICFKTKCKTFKTNGIVISKTKGSYTSLEDFESGNSSTPIYKSKTTGTFCFQFKGKKNYSILENETIACDNSDIDIKQANISGDIRQANRKRKELMIDINI